MNTVWEIKYASCPQLDQDLHGEDKYDSCSEKAGTALLEIMDK